ncbi:MAG: hypothetical protein ACYS9X_05135 [Planctomycetota bacterium]|jgi:hypothetical protein
MIRGPDGRTICAAAAALLAAGGCFRTADPVGEELGLSARNNGPLVAKLEFPEAEYRVGDEIVAVCSLKNISDRPVTIRRPECWRYVRPEALRFVLIGPDGVELEAPSSGQVCGTPFLARRPHLIVTVDAGESHSWEHQVYSRHVENGVLWGETGYDLDAPGTYAARFRCTDSGGSYKTKLPLEDTVGEDGRPVFAEKTFDLTRYAARSAMAQLRVGHGVPREALGDPPAPEDVFGPRYRLAPEGWRSRLPEEMRRRLSRRITAEFASETTLGAFTGFIRGLGTSFVEVEDAVAERALQTPLKVTDMPLGCALWWAIRLTGTRLTIRDGALVISEPPVPIDDQIDWRDMPDGDFWRRHLRSVVERRMSLEFRDTPALEAAQCLADLTKVPVFLDSVLHGRKATYRFDNVSFKEGLDRFVGLVGADYEVRCGAVYIFPVGSKRK